MYLTAQSCNALLQASTCTRHEHHCSSIQGQPQVTHDPDQIQRHTRLWLERAVIGLNLCPFAKAVHVRGQIHWALSPATTLGGVLSDLQSELKALVQAEPAERDTTLLVTPEALHDFLDMLDLLEQADGMLRKMNLEGVIQIASFHPRYQFAGASPNDIENFTNRAPYPVLHLLREESVDQAVAAFPDARAIYETNIRTLRRLGHEGWRQLMSNPNRGK